MTDEQFDELAKSALAFEAGPASETVWSRVKPRRFVWLPTVPEILVCGCVGAAVLLAMGFGVGRGAGPDYKDNSVVAGAIRDETGSVLASVTRMPGVGADGRGIGSLTRL